VTGEKKAHCEMSACWGIAGALGRSGVSGAQYDAIVGCCRSAIGSAWRPEYGLPANVLSGRTRRLALGEEGVRPFRFVRRFEDEHARKPDVARTIILAQHGYQFVSLRPWLSLTGAAFPVDGGNAAKLEWYQSELVAGRAAKGVHVPQGLKCLVAEELDFGLESVLRCPYCCRPVMRGGTFARGASQAEFLALRRLASHGILDWYDLGRTLADAERERSTREATEGVAPRCGDAGGRDEPHGAGVGKAP
jgi:hypothetical protein